MCVNQMSPKPQSDALSIEVIEAFAEFEALRGAWHALSARDPASGFYLSWDWLAQLFRDNPGRWRVLVLRDPDWPDRLIAALPLRVSLRWSGSRKTFQTMLSAAGRLGFSEYTGFLCDPAHERWAIAALGSALSTMPFERVSLRYEPTVGRLRRFAAAFEPQMFESTWPDHRINGGETNQLVAPQIVLPDSFDSYTASLSRNRRKKLFKARRALEGDSGLHFRLPDATSFDADRDAVLTLWRMRWDGQMSADKVADTSRAYGVFLDRCWALGVLHMPMLWQGDRMIGALGNVMDRGRGQMTCVVTGRDTEENTLEIILLMHAHAIESAISQDFSTYDFGHGDEPYKYSLGARDVALGNISIRRRSRAPGGRFDPVGFGPALARVRSLIRSGKTADAQAALTQLQDLLGHASIQSADAAP
jgi:CelD/BcsL family acetyltransferase involved in cellulose biosynthesis